ncbi:MAG: glycosyltransferase [Verrucomicrobiota bacterium]
MEAFSLIIPSSGREDDLRKVLSSLAFPLMNIREILVVWDGKASPSIEEDFSSCRYLGPLGGSGPAAARNRGAAAASGEWLLFLDDDVVPCAGAIGIIEQSVREHPETGAWVFNVSAHPDIERNIYVKWAYSSRAHAVYPDGAVPVSPSQFCSSFIAVRRNVFEELNGFNESLHWFEDVEFAFRAKKRGVPLYSAGSVKGLHLKQMDREWFVNRCRKLGPGLLTLHSQYSQAVSRRVAFMMSHPGLCRSAGLLCLGWRKMLPVIERMPGPTGIALLDLAALAGMTDSLSAALSEGSESSVTSRC